MTNQNEHEKRQRLSDDTTIIFVPSQAKPPVTTWTSSDNQTPGDESDTFPQFGDIDWGIQTDEVIELFGKPPASSLDDETIHSEIEDPTYQAVKQADITQIGSTQEPESSSGSEPDLDAAPEYENTTIVSGAIGNDSPPDSASVDEELGLAVDEAISSAHDEPDADALSHDAQTGDEPQVDPEAEEPLSQVVSALSESPEDQSPNEASDSPKHEKQSAVSRPARRFAIPIVAVVAVILVCVLVAPTLAEYLSNQIDVPYTVTYVDAISGSEIASATSATGKNNSEVMVEAPDIEGYELTTTTVIDGETSTDQQGAHSVELMLNNENDQAVVFAYTKNVSLTVKYVDAETGEAVADPKQIAGLDHQTVTAEAPEIEGYKLKASTISAEGTEDVVSEESSLDVVLSAKAPQTVTFSYAKQVSYTIKHRDWENTIDVAPEQTGTGYSGDTITAEVSTELNSYYYRNPDLGTTQTLVLQNDESQNVIVFNYDYSPPQTSSQSNNGGGGGYPMLDNGHF